MEETIYETTKIAFEISVIVSVNQFGFLVQKKISDVSISILSVSKAFLSVSSVFNLLNEVAKSYLCVI